MLVDVVSDILTAPGFESPRLHSKGSEMKKWEYKVIGSVTGASNTRAYQQQLNEYGSEGWEMCAETCAEYLVFKREKITPRLTEDEIARMNAAVPPPQPELVGGM